MILTSIEKIKDWHRSHYIIHTGDTVGSMDYFAEFATGKQLDEFMLKLGITRTGKTRRHLYEQEDNLYQEMPLSHSLIQMCFWKLEELPKGAKPIKALSNGSIVTCYFVRRKGTIIFYRPNPNAGDDVYDPLPINEHIAHVQLHGLY